MSSLIKRIMAEYDEVKGDGHFDEGHPVFQMAQQIDVLESHMRGIWTLLVPCEVIHDDDGEAYFVVDPEVCHQLLSDINKYWVDCHKGEDG